MRLGRESVGRAILHHRRRRQRRFRVVRALRPLGGCRLRPRDGIVAFGGKHVRARRRWRPSSVLRERGMLRRAHLLLTRMQWLMGIGTRRRLRTSTCLADRRELVEVGLSGSGSWPWSWRRRSRSVHLSETRTSRWRHRARWVDRSRSCRRLTILRRREWSRTEEGRVAVDWGECRRTSTGRLMRLEGHRVHLLDDARRPARAMVGVGAGLRGSRRDDALLIGMLLLKGCRREGL